MLSARFVAFMTLGILLVLAFGAKAQISGDGGAETDNEVSNGSGNPDDSKEGDGPTIMVIVDVPRSGDGPRADNGNDGPDDDDTTRSGRLRAFLENGPIGQRGESHGAMQAALSPRPISDGVASFVAPKVMNRRANTVKWIKRIAVFVGAAVLVGVHQVARAGTAPNF